MGDLLDSLHGAHRQVLDLSMPLDQVAEGYRAMDERRAIKIAPVTERRRSGRPPPR
jgi:hypothetical protein